jgi:hypothetical protein
LARPDYIFFSNFFASKVVAIAFVEVNFGTSVIHESILLLPLVFFYVRLASRANQTKANEFSLQ